MICIFYQYTLFFYAGKNIHKTGCCYHLKFIIAAINIVASLVFSLISLLKRIKHKNAACCVTEKLQGLKTFLSWKTLQFE